MAVKVLVVEDDEGLARAITGGLEENGILTKHFTDGVEALKALKEQHFDMVILDIMLPNMDGYQVCRKIREINREIPVLFLSAMDQISDKVKGLDLGANDYMTKPFDTTELIARVRVQTRPKETISEGNVLRYADLELDLNRHQVTRGGKAVALTPKEFSLLEFFMRSPERLQSRVVIEEKVWDRNVELYTNVVDVYVNHLRKKINFGGLPNLIHAVRGTGYIFELQGEEKFQR